jgi:hypothetical protein
MSSNIIELRQENADTVNSNGDFVVNMPYNKQLVLEQGDSLVVKNVFIDTEAQSSQKINIEKEMTLEIDIMKYYIWTRADNIYKADGTGVTTDVVDGQFYVLAGDVGGIPNLSEITQVLTLSETGGCGGNFTINYTNSDGVATKKTFPVNPSSFPFTVTNISLIYTNTQPVTFTDQQYQTSSIKTESAVGATHLEPIQDKVSITIPKGTYSSTQFVELMNSEFDIGGRAGEANGYGQNDILTAYTSEYLVKWDGTKMYKISGGSLLLGASQLEFEFLSDTNQYAINYAHTPYLYGGSQAAQKPYQPSVGFLVLGGGATPITINKNSGILFSALSSFYTQDPSTELNFWEDTLGFGDSLKPKVESAGSLTYGGLTSDVFKLSTEPLDEVQTTGGYLGLSMLIDKLNDKWYEPVDTTVGDFMSTSTDTFNIIGSQNTVNTVNYGYFLVEINSSYKTNFYSKDNNLNIGAIVSRYYELNSYTSATSDASLQYIHTSPVPINLNTFRVRVLKPDKTLVGNLGDGTSIYLELIKGQGQMQPLQLQQKSK